MILQCPSCSARFLVNDALIPLEGRDVRCGRCKHTWFITPNPVPIEGMEREKAPVFADFDHALASATADEADDMAKSAGNDAQLPAVKIPSFTVKRALLPTAGLVFTALIVALFAHYPSWKNAPVTGSIYRAIGYKDTTGLAFADVVLVREEREGKTLFLLSGNIMNRNESEAVVPEVRVKLLDKDGGTIWSRSYDVNKRLNAHDIYPFRITNAETAFGDKVAQVEVDLGNGYELMVR